MYEYFCIILSAVLICAINAEVDCSKRLDPRDVEVCCKTPKPDFTSFQSQCGEQFITIQRAPSACFLECMFNASSSLNGDELNIGNVRKMLSKLYAESPDFVEAYTKTFEKCAPIVSQRIAEFKNKQKGTFNKGVTAPNCPLVGTFYAICAHRNVIMNCPSSAWTSTPTCETAREYATICEPKFGGLGGRRGVSSQGQRGGQRSGRGRREVTQDENLYFKN